MKQQIQDRPDNLQFRKNDTDAIWVPDDAKDIHLRLCVIAHTGPAGHRGATSTWHAVWLNFYLTTMEEDIRLFVNACLHCLSTSGGGARPVHTARHYIARSQMTSYSSTT